MSANRLERLPVVASMLILSMGGAAHGASTSVAVSPGSETGTVIENRCPTFSWAAVPGAESYEMVVYRSEDDGEEAEVALEQSFTGSVFSWTPPLDRCLERGGKYGWSVRASGRERGSAWSPPSLFEVAPGPSLAVVEEALAVVREYLKEVGREPAGLGARAVAAGEATGIGDRAGATPAGGPALLSEIAGDAALLVNGAAVVTTATLGAGLCEALTYRYVDLGDGTVLDCNTGRMWLKDANCLGGGNWVVAQGTIDALNSGSDFGCAEYTPGTYADWSLPAMTDLCGLWDGSCVGVSCCTAAAGIIDTSFSDPTVGNAAGNGQWAEEDSFVGVQSARYWSADPNGRDEAWNVNLMVGSTFSVDQLTFADFVWAVRDPP